MAYTREDKENLEVLYSLDAIWEAIPKVVDSLNWKIEETDKAIHHLKIKTKGGFLSYPSTFKVDLAIVDEKTTKMSLFAETPVTTITSMADYGRTRERIDQFIVALAKLMESSK
jgi:hypothetical protein